MLNSDWKSFPVIPDVLIEMTRLSELPLPMKRVVRTGKTSLAITRGADPRKPNPTRLDRINQNDTSRSLKSNGFDGAGPAWDRRCRFRCVPSRVFSGELGFGPQPVFAGSHVSSNSGPAGLSRIQRNSRPPSSSHKRWPKVRTRTRAMASFCKLDADIPSAEPARQRTGRARAGSTVRLSGGWSSSESDASHEPTVLTTRHCGSIIDGRCCRFAVAESVSRTRSDQPADNVAKSSERQSMARPDDSARPKNSTGQPRTVGRNHRVQHDCPG